MAAQKSYDLFVIGTGPGGYTAATARCKKGPAGRYCRRLQLRGHLHEQGCIPAKTYIESINLYDHMKNARRFGIEAGSAMLTLEALYKRKTRIVTRLAKGIEYLLNQAGVDIYRGYAGFADREFHSNRG
ncbi:MAG: FAD-dependent oxidoreductase [Desulfomicrobium escambiense]|nr:FAD-dependent oxidoreductase [Desulfomicrobium escambiense]